MFIISVYQLVSNMYSMKYYKYKNENYLITNLSVQCCKRSKHRLNDPNAIVHAVDANVIWEM